MNFVKLNRSGDKKVLYINLDIIECIHGDIHGKGSILQNQEGMHTVTQSPEEILRIARVSNLNPHKGL